MKWIGGMDVDVHDAFGFLDTDYHWLLVCNFSL